MTDDHFKALILKAAAEHAAGDESSITLIARMCAESQQAKSCLREKG